MKKFAVLLGQVTEQGNGTISLDFVFVLLQIDKNLIPKPFNLSKSGLIVSTMPGASRVFIGL